MSDSRISQKAQHLARIRDNQRRSRARRKEYLQELETKLRTYEQIGIEASSEIQSAARTVLEENRKLKAILRDQGMSEQEVSAVLENTPDQHSKQVPAASRLSEMLEGKTKPDLNTSTTSHVASHTKPTLIPRHTPPVQTISSIPPRSTDFSYDDSPSPGSIISAMSTPPPSSYSTTFYAAPSTPPGTEIKIEDVAYEYPYNRPYNSSWTHSGDFGYPADPFNYYNRSTCVEAANIVSTARSDPGTELDTSMGYRYPDQYSQMNNAALLNMMNGYSHHAAPIRASIPVDWAIPKAKRKNAFDRKYLDDYAQPLYEREPDELRPMQAGLPEAQIRTPIYQKDGKDMVAGDANQSSAALRDLYNEIKRLSAKEPDGLHDIAALTGQFEEGDENAAVVLSRAENQEVFVLDTERRLQVTVNDQTAHVDLIRRVPTGVGNQRLGHFIEVPLGTSITVNGITYTNQGSSSPTPFFIGPLEDFAVIELLSQPLFFFRHEGSLKYKATTRKAAQDEMERRDRNGDVARDDVIIRWLPIGSPEVTSQEEDEYSDAFTEDGRRIENPHSYFKTRLNQHLEDKVASLIPRVIASINHRQPENAGFSFIHESTVFRPDRTLLTALTQQSGRNLLLVAQVQQPEKRIRVRVLYPLFWRSSGSHLSKINQNLRRWILASGSSEQMTENLLMDTEWVPCAQTTTQEASSTYTILNAWALAMGLEPNPEFTPTRHGDEAFFIQAEGMFHLALENALTWKLLLSFLHCTEFVKPAVTRETDDDEDADLPAQDRRFDLRKRPFDTLIANQTKADETFPAKEIETKQTPVQLEDGILHSETNRSDSLSNKQLNELLPLVREGRWRLQDIAKRPEQYYYEDTETSEESFETPLPVKDSPVQPLQLDTFPVPADKHISPCESLRDTLSQLLANEEIQKELEEFRSNDIITTEKGEWLDDSESALAISAVTMAINQMQSIEEGFSIVQSQFVQLCQACGGADMENCMLDALRPGRPLLAPISFKSHIVLLLAQLDEQGRPTISFVDSLFCHYDAEDREKLFNIGWQVLRGSSWWRGVFADKNAFEKVKPKSATWVETARQPSSNECGYFTILNAWGLAMGLELNQDVRLRWTDSFFQELQDMVHLVRLGHANWKLMFDFLQCHDIVRDGIVPGNRRFSRTHSTRAEPKFDDNLANLLATEKLHWARQKYQTEALERIRNANRIPNMTGRPHNGKKAFPSDGWIDVTKKYEYVPRLQRFGLLNIDHREREMEAAFRNLSKTRVESCLKKLPPANSQSITSNQEALLQVIRDEIKLQYEGMDSDIQREPHEWIEDTLDFYDQIRKTAKLQQMLSNKGIVKPNDWQRLMEDSDLNLAMASVLEAIDNLQSGLHAASGSQHPFASGFALTTSNALQMALHGIESVPFSRPRRTWLIPLVATKNGLLEQLEVWAKTNGKKYKSPTGRAGGHAFLVVVQEAINHDPENPAETRFETHIFDSCLRIFDDVRDFFSVRVENAAASLKWSTQRNEFGAVQFDTGAFIHENLPQQMAGGFQCGHHVLINAWIIAMGLHFDPEAQYTTEIYKQLYTLAQAATAGILDWRTLAAWFFCHKLTVERTFDAVPENRRFGCTVVQRDERTLEGRITEQYAVQDAALEMFSLAQVPYDYSNNFVMIGGENGGETSWEHTENSGEDSDSSNSLFGLKRRVDDAEGDFLEKRRGIKRKWTRGLRFLDRYGEGDGEQNAGGQAGKKRRLLGHLTPLDVQD
ncbi:hypothetical protein J3E74DRAFT_259339 [Bipolaris maydis]|nr:hypothetical protein J3E74DRAFT_259339 [Bipolaris maydis]